jgi:hypothetical protein
MDSNNTIESPRPTFDSLSHQTPFEKSLRRRVLKVKEVIALMEAEPEYTSVADLSSVDELRRAVRAYEALDAELSNAVLRYIDVSFVRKALFKGEQASLKNIAYALKTSVIKDKTLKNADLRNVRTTYAAIFAQNPLSPPYDLARPHFEKDFEAFNLSYQMLLENFRLLVSRAYKLDVLPETFPYPQAATEALISKGEELGREISVLMQKVFVVYEERLFVFEQIKERCNAICNRSRFVLGSHHSVYKKVFSLKHAIM